MSISYSIWPTITAWFRGWSALFCFNSEFCRLRVVKLFESPAKVVLESVDRSGESEALCLRIRSSGEIEFHSEPNVITDAFLPVDSGLVRDRKRT